jgi:hypothetical protein
VFFIKIGYCHILHVLRGSEESSVDPRFLERRVSKDNQDSFSYDARGALSVSAFGVPCVASGGFRLSVICTVAGERNQIRRKPPSLDLHAVYAATEDRDLSRRGFLHSGSLR